MNAKSLKNLTNATLPSQQPQPYIPYPIVRV